MAVCSAVASACNARRRFAATIFCCHSWALLIWRPTPNCRFFPPQAVTRGREGSAYLPSPGNLRRKDWLCVICTLQIIAGHEIKRLPLPAPRQHFVRYSAWLVSFSSSVYLRSKQYCIVYHRFKSRGRREGVTIMGCKTITKNVFLHNHPESLTVKWNIYLAILNRVSTLQAGKALVFIVFFLLYFTTESDKDTSGHRERMRLFVCVFNVCERDRESPRAHACAD